jgi:diguanylate cyclase
VCLEITERGCTRNRNHLKALEEFKEIGAQIAVDDFGKGYVLLSHLKSLPVDAPTIGAGFARDLGTSPGDLAIVRSIVGLAKAFKL